MITVPERLKSEVELIRKAMEALSSSLRVAMPGIIQSFDAATQTVTVKVTIKEKVNNDGTLEDVEIPLLLDVPIVILQAGGFSITVPIQNGTECLVVFADMCIDGWWQNGGVQVQGEKRRHDLSDGFAIVGTVSKPNAISGYKTDRIQMRNSDASVTVDVLANELKLVSGASSFDLKNTEIDLVTTSFKINGKDFMLHTHAGVIPGTGASGGVNP